MIGSETPKLDLDPSFLLDCRPLAGRCVIELDQPPTMEGLIHIPESAQGTRIRDKAAMGTVLKMTPRLDVTEDFQVGDRVWVMLTLEDIRVSHRLIHTFNTRVYARALRPGES